MKFYFLNCRFTFKDDYVETIEKITQIIFDPLSYCVYVYYLFSGEVSCRICDLSSVHFYTSEYIPVSSFKPKQAFYLDEIESLINFYTDVFSIILKDE